MGIGVKAGIGVSARWGPKTDAKWLVSTQVDQAGFAACSPLG